MKQLKLGRYIPQRLPHYHRRDRGVFFMISPRPALDLSEQEIPLFETIDGCRSVAELERLCPGATTRLARWHEAGVIEFIPPLSSPAFPHLVVVEPHMDDAALSVGGRLLHRRGKCRITILSVVKWSNFTSCLSQNRSALFVEEVTELRQKETALAARVLGAQTRCLDWVDSPLRMIRPDCWSAAVFDEFEKHPEKFVERFPNADEVALLSGQLTCAFEELGPDEIWIPMGLADHVDHRTTRNACLRLLSESPDLFTGVSVSMYEDTPSVSAKRLGHDRRIHDILAVNGARLIPVHEDIGDVFTEKVRVASLYASQFRSSNIEPVLRVAARQEIDGKEELVETLHRLEGRVEVLRESDLCQEAESMGVLRAQVAEWLRAWPNHERLTVIVLPSGGLGCWARDTEFLFATFPNLDLRVYLAASSAWQTGDSAGMVRFKVVRGAGWAGAAFREFFRFGCSTLVLWNGAYGAGLRERFRPFTAISVICLHAFVQCLLPFRRVFFSQSLSDLCGVMAEHLESNKPAKSVSPLYETIS